PCATDCGAANLDLVLRSVHSEPVGAVRESGPAGLFNLAPGALCRRSVPRQTPADTEEPPSAAAIPEPLRSDRDERLHVLCGAVFDSSRPDHPVSYRQGVLAFANESR